jgi:hypothetical protein
MKYSLTEQDVVLIKMAIEQTMAQLPSNTVVYKAYATLGKLFKVDQPTKTIKSTEKITKSTERKRISDKSIIKKYNIICLDANLRFRNIDEAVRYINEVRPYNGSADKLKERYLTDCLMGRHKTAYQLHWRLEMHSTGDKYYYKDDKS